jgi:hypothetical protein
VKYDSCTIHVRWSGDDTSLAELVAHVLGETADRFATIESSAVTVDVQLNHAYDPERPDNFLHWRFYLDIIRNVDASSSAMVGAVSSLLEALWHGDIDAVAGCDFEDELPRHGGIDASNSKWPTPL